MDVFLKARTAIERNRSTNIARLRVWYYDRNNQKQNFTQDIHDAQKQC